MLKSFFFPKMVPFVR